MTQLCQHQKQVPVCVCLVCVCLDDKHLRFVSIVHLRAITQLPAAGTGAVSREIVDPQARSTFAGPSRKTVARGSTHERYDLVHLADNQDFRRLAKTIRMRQRRKA